MDILLLSQWYPPEPEFKVSALAKGLAMRGHRVLVITGFPNYPTGKLYPGYKIRLWRWEQEQGGVRVLRVALYPDHSRSAVKRTLNYGSFAASASLLGPILSGPADVMFVYHAPLTVGIPALLISRTRGVPFVFAIHDMWPETLAASGMVGNHLVLDAIGRFALYVYRQAAEIVVVSPGFKRNLIAKGVLAEKIHVIPNWADENLYHPVEPDPELAASYGLSGKFNIMYAGNLGLAQRLDVVLQAAVLLEDLPDLQFVLIGDGADADRLREMAQEARLANVRFIDQQPASRMASFYALADVLLAHLKRDPLFEITIPSKVFPYLACARPILMAVAGDAADIVRDAQAGLCCPPEDPVAMADAIRRLYFMPSEARREMGLSGRQTFLAKYSTKVLIDRYEELFREMANRQQANTHN